MKRKIGKKILAWSLATAILLTAAEGLPTEGTKVSAAKAASTTLPTGDVLMKGVSCTAKSLTAIENASIENVSDDSQVVVADLRFASASASTTETEDYGYAQLSAAQQELYDDADAAFEAYVSGSYYQSLDYDTGYEGYDSSNKLYVAFSLDKTFSEYGLSTYQGLQVYFTYRNNHPRYYWISTSYYATASTFTVILDSYYLEAADRAETDEKIESGIEEYTEEALEYGDTAYEQAKAVHDKLIDDVEYAYQSNGKTPETAIWAHSIAGAFCEEYNGSKGMVCEGYAKTYQLILQELGIDCIYIVGTGSGSSHAWNAIEMSDGKYYYVDTTWDDMGADTNDGRNYVYFCTPKSYWTKTHTAYKSTSKKIASWLYALPSNIGNDMSYTYYEQNYAYFSNIASISEADTLLTVAGAANPNDTGYLHILCASKSDVTYVVSQLDVGCYYRYSGYGYVVIAPEGDYAVDSPLESYLDVMPKGSTDTGYTIDRQTSSEVVFQAVPYTATDDVLVWSVTGDGPCSISDEVSCISESKTGDAETTVTFGGSGTYTVTARALAGGCEGSYTITVTNSAQYLDGSDYIDFSLWVNGKTYVKKVDVTDQLDGFAATNWTTTNSKGVTKTNKGKLGYLVLASPLDGEDGSQVVFNTTKHTVTTKAKKADKALATVTSKGVVTLKKPGTAYVYVYDTGSCTSKEIVISSTVQEMEKKSYTITPTITATNWYNTSGKLQKGKIVWVAKKERTTIQFNSTKHTVTTTATKADKAVGTVSSKGVVTAKASGDLYIYACDTGSMTAEEYVCKVKNAPKTVKILYNSKVAKKMELPADADTSDSLQVVGKMAKASNVIDDDVTFKATVASKYQDYVTCSVDKADDGYYYLVVTRKNNDVTAALKKAVKMTVKVTCTQSLKSSSIQLVFYPQETAVSSVNASVSSVKTITLKTAGKKSVVQLQVKAKKVKAATGYCVQYSTSRKFKKSKTKTITSKKRVAKIKTVLKNKKKKTYYVRTRVYQKISGVKYYSAWSKTKKVKVKKKA